MNLQEIEDGKTVFLDSNIFIYEFSSHEKYGEACLKFLQRVENTDILGVTSVGVLDEVLYKSMLIELSNIESTDISEASVGLRDNPQKIQKLERSISNIEKVFEMPVRVLGISEQVFKSGMKNIKKYNLRPHDATILQIMDFYGIENIATNDSDFESVDWLNIFKPSEDQ